MSQRICRSVEDDFLASGGPMQKPLDLQGQSDDRSEDFLDASAFSPQVHKRVAQSMCLDASLDACNAELVRTCCRLLETEKEFEVHSCDSCDLASCRFLSAHPNDVSPP